jgi:hypothetical protein
MKNYSCIFLLSILLLSYSQCVLAGEQTSLIVPETWMPKKILDNNSYMNITGDYELLGEAGSGTPNYLMGQPQWLLYLDTITGIDIRGPLDNREDVTRVHIEQKDCTGLELAFYSKDIVLVKRTVSGSDKAKISCNREAFRCLETAVGGTGRTMDKDTSYYLSEDDSLILHSIFSGIDRSRIFFGLFWNHFRYEYLVRFKRK